MRRTHPDDLWIEIGRVHKPHGKRGTVLVQPHSGSPDALEAGRVIRLIDARGRETDERVDRAQSSTKGILVDLAGCDGYERARELSGARVSVRRADLAALEEDEVFVADLIGLRAVHPDGTEAGTVGDAVDNGAQLVLFLEGTRGDTVLFHRDWVGEPDFEAGTLPLKREPVR